MEILTHMTTPGQIRVRVVDAPTEDSIARAKDAQQAGRAEGIARLLAHFSGIERLDLEPEATRKHFAQWGWIAVRGAELSSEQFRTVGLALHASAQAGADLEGHLEHFAVPDLLMVPADPYELNRIQRLRSHWTQMATRIIRTYLNVLGNETTEQATSLYGSRLRLVGEQEASHGDPRRI